MKYLCIVILIIAGLVVGCKPSPTTYSAHAIKIGYLPTTDVMPYVMAVQLGIFDSLGVEVQLVEMQSARQRDTLFEKNQLDGCLISTLELLRAQEAGAKITPAIMHTGLHFLVASPDSTIQRVKDLAGKCVAVENYGITEFVAHLIREKQGWDVDELNLPNIASDSLRMRMVAEGQVDAAILPYRYVWGILDKGVKVLDRSTAYHKALAVTVFPDSIMETRGAEITLLTQGYNLAVNYMNDNLITEWWPSAYRHELTIDHVDNFPYFKASTPLTPKHKTALVKWMHEK